MRQALPPEPQSLSVNPAPSIAAGPFGSSHPAAGAPCSLALSKPRAATPTQAAGGHEGGWLPEFGTCLDSGTAAHQVTGMAEIKTITVQTSGQGLYEITDAAASFVAAAGTASGLLTLFVRHTSASLIVQENADGDVVRDLQAFFTRLVPPATSPAMDYLVHRLEGPDDMPAHIKAALTQTSLSVPVMSGRMMLGRWQGIYLFEHRDRPHRREIVLCLVQ